MGSLYKLTYMFLQRNVVTDIVFFFFVITGDYPSLDLIDTM